MFKMYIVIITENGIAIVSTKLEQGDDNKFITFVNGRDLTDDAMAAPTLLEYVDDSSKAIINASNAIRSHHSDIIRHIPPYPSMIRQTHCCQFRLLMINCTFP